MTIQDVQQAYPDFYAMTADGIVYSAATAVTGVAPGTAYGTTAAFTLHNPTGSEVNLVILKGHMGYVSGTLGAGVVSWLVNATRTESVPSGTAITPVNRLLGGAASVARAFTTATITSPTQVRPFCSLGASLASTAVGPWQVVDDVDGGIIVPPGCNVSLHATAAAGSSPLVVFAVTWAEVSND